MREYTLAQLQMFTEAVERARKRRLADQLVTLRAAQYPSNEFKAYLKKLTD